MSFNYVKGDKISNKLMCCICAEPAVSPLVHTACSRLFCRSCISTWLEERDSCPQCRALSCLSDYRHDAFIKGLLDELVVLCPNQTRGCQWQGDRGDMAEHFKLSCGFLVCPANGCDFVGSERAVAEHECVFQVVPCPAGCGERLERRNLPNHQAVCASVQSQMEHLEKLQSLCETKNPSSLIGVNAGGQVFHVRSQTMQKYPSSVLGVLFSSQQKVHKDQAGNILLDVQPQTFQLIVTWLQYGVLPKELSSLERCMLLEESRQLRLDDLLAELQKPMRLSQLTWLRILNSGSPSLKLVDLDLT